VNEDMLQRVGMTLAGRFRITAPLAQGGMGAVFEGVDEETGGAVAIKLLRKEFADSQEAMVRFRREIEASERIEARQIVVTHHADVTEDGTPYMVMERLWGRDLDAVIAGAPLDQARAIALIIDLLDGLAHAHAAGVVHRDLKPSNVFLTDDDTIKILDFGIAKVFDDAKVDGGETGKVTSTQAVLGSPAYLSPEQLVSSREVDGRTDIWSVGVILYELLTGVSLFGGETVGAIFSNVIKMPIAPLATRRRGIDPRLDAVVQRCLERDPSDRYQTVIELTDDLSELAGGPTSILPEATGPAAPRSGHGPLTSEAALIARRNRRRAVMNGLLLAGALLLLGAVTAGGAVLFLAHREPAGVATPEPTAFASPAMPIPEEPTASPRVSHEAKPEPAVTAPVESVATTAAPSATSRPVVAPEPAVEDELWEGSRQ
jgi:serine/threonine-protein kinase